MNQRRFPRVNYRCTVSMSQNGKYSTIPAVTENLGLGGVCLMLEQQFDIFSPAGLEISIEDGKPAVKVQGTIVWVVRRKELGKKMAFDTGIEFSSLTPQDKARIEAVLDKIVGS
jgi:hypothetical protein